MAFDIVIGRDEADKARYLKDRGLNPL